LVVAHLLEDQFGALLVEVPDPCQAAQAVLR
jgi:hypothetical protein